jgi:hypothetical protein
MLYRIYTENTKRQHVIRDAVSKRYPGFTLIKGVGYWQGKREQSLIIEIITPRPDDKTILKLAGDIKRLNRQESVLVVKYPVDSVLV